MFDYAPESAEDPSFYFKEVFNDCEKILKEKCITDFAKKMATYLKEDIMKQAIKEGSWLVDSPEYRRLIDYIDIFEKIGNGKKIVKNRGRMKTSRDKIRPKFKFLAILPNLTENSELIVNPNSNAMSGSIIEKQRTLYDLTDLKNAENTQTKLKTLKLYKGAIDRKIGRITIKALRKYAKDYMGINLMRINIKKFPRSIISSLEENARKVKKGERIYKVGEIKIIKEKKSQQKIPNTRAIQQALVKLGFNIGKYGVDGIAGTDTIKGYNDCAKEYSISSIKSWKELTLPSAMLIIKKANSLKTSTEKKS